MGGGQQWVPPYTADDPPHWSDDAEGEVRCVKVNALRACVDCTRQGLGFLSRLGIGAFYSLSFLIGNEILRRPI